MVLAAVFALSACLFLENGDRGDVREAVERLSRTVADYQRSIAAQDISEARDFPLFTKVYSQINHFYVRDVDGSSLVLAGAKGVREKYEELDKVTAQALDVAATEGMLSTLDKYSAYLDVESYSALQENLQGVFGGLGIEITKRTGRLTIIAPIENTPADRAGLKAGDIITHADGQPIDPLSQREAVKLLRGRAGTSVRLTILREGAGSFEVTITRETIEDNPVRWHLEGDVGYIRISTFNKKTGDEVYKAVLAIQSELGPRLAGFVLDLRNNPGGILSQAVDVTSIFLDGGVVVSTKRRQNPDVLNALRGDITNDSPLVILINRGSASASEIVSGAIQDQHRGFLVGEKSFGKGSVQTIFKYRDGSGLRLTTALYYTPSGKTVEGGIEPDQPIKQDEDRDGDEQLEEALKLVIHMAGGPSVPWGAGLEIQ